MDLLKLLQTEPCLNLNLFLANSLTSYICIEKYYGRPNLHIFNQINTQKLSCAFLYVHGNGSNGVVNFFIPANYLLRCN